MNAESVTFRKKFQDFNSKAAFFCAIGFMFFIPISTALMNIFIFFTFIFFCLSANFKKNLLIIWQNPVSKSALILFGLLLLGMTWSITGLIESLEVLKKYNELWYLGFLIPVFNTNQRREMGIIFFLTSMGVILFGVYLMFFGVILPIEISFHGKTQHFNIDGGFASHIITNILMAFAMFISAHKAINAKGLLKLFYFFYFIFSSYYVIFISSGTTGQIIGISLLALILFQYLKKVALIIIPILLVSISLYSTINVDSSINHAIDKIMNRIDKSRPTYTAEINSRPQLYIHAIKVILEDPWIGTGTGSYKEAIKTKQLDFYKRTHHIKNPHSEYLMISVQLGLIGLLALVYLFAIQGISSFKIKNNEQKYMAQGLVVLILIGCIFNSLLMDSRDGHFWAFFSALLFSNLVTKDSLPSN
jgi:O-antigen ligase